MPPWYLGILQGANCRHSLALVGGGRDAILMAEGNQSITFLSQEGDSTGNWGKQLERVIPTVPLSTHIHQDPMKPAVAVMAPRWFPVSQVFCLPLLQYGASPVLLLHFLRLLLNIEEEEGVNNFALVITSFSPMISYLIFSNSIWKKQTARGPWSRSQTSKWLKTLVPGRKQQRGEWCLSLSIPA